MNFTKEQLNEMQEYLIDNLNLISINHTYPKEESILNMLLVMVAQQRIE